MVDRRFKGFADLLFSESAHLALARAAEASGTDVEARHPTAFAVEDRGLRFSVDAPLPAAEVDSFRRLLEALVLEAADGEATLEVENGERWELRAGPHRSTRVAPQISGATELDDFDARPTLRTDVG
jgi:hypothetical protein